MNVKNLVLGIGIFIVFMFLLHYGIKTVYDSPKYDAYCNSSQFNYNYPEKMPVIASNCTYTGSIRNAEQKCYDAGGQPIYEYDDSGCTSSVKECNYCNKYFNESTNNYNKVVFIIALIIGIIVLLIGYLVLSVEPVGSSLMASGIGAIIYGALHNWENLGNLWRFLLLLIALVLLIWIALRLNKNTSKQSKKK